MEGVQAALHQLEAVETAPFATPFRCHTPKGSRRRLKMGLW